MHKTEQQVSLLLRRNTMLTPAHEFYCLYFLLFSLQEIAGINFRFYSPVSKWCLSNSKNQILLLLKCGSQLYLPHSIPALQVAEVQYTCHIAILSHRNLSSS